MTMTVAKSKAFGLKIAARWKQDAMDLDCQFGTIKVRLNTVEQLVAHLQGDLHNIQNAQDMEVPLTEAKQELQIIISRFQNTVTHLKNRYKP